WPSAHAGFSKTVTAAGSAARTSTAPTTTITSSTPDATAAATAWPTTEPPRNGASSLCSVAAKRLPPPAARTTAAVVPRPGSAVYGTGCVTQRGGRSPRPQGDDLGEDRDRRLLGGAGADVEPDRPHDTRQLLLGHALGP